MVLRLRARQDIMPTQQLNLPYIISSQSQKEVTHNDALNMLDVLVQLSVMSATTATPPASPSDGDSYIVPSSPTGAWSGQTGKIAAYYAGWTFHTPKEGWRAWVRDTDKTLVYNGGWSPAASILPAGSAGAPALIADGDADTGVFFPAADTLACTTGGSERFRVTSTGLFGVGITPTSRLHVSNSTNNIAASIASSEASKQVLQLSATSTSYASDHLSLLNSTAGGTGFNFINCLSNAGSDSEFRVRGDGTVYSDGGTAMSTPADYADAFEWEDGNPQHEDRVGYAVVLASGGKIRKASVRDKAEDIIGIVSGNPSVCGRTAWNGWSGKYVRDAFNRPVVEDAAYVEWTDEGQDGVIQSYAGFEDDLEKTVLIPLKARRSIKQRRKVNSAYKAEEGGTYVPRLARKEWDAVGLCGCLPLRKGQPTHPHWHKLRSLNEEVEEWLVR